MTKEEMNALRTALWLNAEANEPILMSSSDTSFEGIVELDERGIEESMVNAIKSVPTHY